MSNRTVPRTDTPQRPTQKPAGPPKAKVGASPLAPPAQSVLLPRLSGRLAWVGGLVTSLVWFVVYLTTVSPTVNFIDSGELITDLYEPGIAHPPGYPLYTLLGYVVSHMLPGEVAWRVNLISAFSAAVAAGLMFVLICRVLAYTAWLLSQRKERPASARSDKRANGRKQPAPVAQAPVDVPREDPGQNQLTVLALLGAASGASLLAAASAFWNRADQAKMYTMHYAFVAAVFLLAVGARWAFDRSESGAARRWLVGLALVLGFSLTNHLMTTVLFPGVLVLLLWGRDWSTRIRWTLQQWKVALPALLLPLLLYLYLPLRSAQGPVMNWGSPNNLGDFVRHVTGWQYSTYLADDLSVTIPRFWDYLAAQWSLVTGLVVLAALAGAVLLARFNLAVLLGTALTGLANAILSLKYETSEMVPYIMPLYMMLVFWLGCLPVLAYFLAARGEQTSRDMSFAVRVSAGLSVAMILVAVGASVLQYPLQNHSNDRLAEQFASNTYKSLEPNSIVLTDLWDFASPSYYEQLVKGVRSDVVIIDKLLLKYPWYVGQLEKRYPWLIANSRDAVDPYKALQRRWVDGDNFSLATDGPQLQQLYINLLTSFVERNAGQHPVYTFFTQGEPEDDQIAPTFTRFPSGLVTRLLSSPPAQGQLPPEPKFDLRGYTYDKTPLDEFSRYDGELYVGAYRSAAQQYAQANRNDVAARLASQADQLESEIRSR